jgi:predicted MFS family arabinose efflux permease
VRESRSEQERKLDIVGLVLGTSALFLVTYGLIEANALGWGNARIIAALAGFAILLGAFLWWELRTEHPMMPLRFFRIPAFSAGNSVAFSIALGMFATFFFLTLYMQNIKGYSPFQAGASFLPLTVMIIVTAPYAGKYASEHGSRAPMTYGLVLAGGGLALLGLLLTPTTSYWVLFPIFLAMGHGMGATMAPMTAAVMNSVGRERAGLGSAMTNTSREVGGVLGIAVLGAILTTKLKGSFTPAIQSLGLTPTQMQSIGENAKHGILTTDSLAALGLTPQQIQSVGAAFRDAFMQGFRPALLFAGTILLIAALVSNRLIPGRETIEEHHAAADAPETVAAH